MSQHTPGPWRLKTTGNYGNTIEARTDEYEDGQPRFSVVCSYQTALPRGNFTYLEEEANAQANGHLIAAAPDLLRLARDYRGSIEFQIRRDLKAGDSEGATMKRLTLRYVENLIAKAEGRSTE